MGIETGRMFAVIPAAGLSRRMGVPKLLLPLWETTILGHLVDTLKTVTPTEIVLVARREQQDLADHARSLGCTVVLPEVDPGEMRVSVQIALEEIEKKQDPSADETWVLIPADHPWLTREVLVPLVEHWKQTKRSMMIPTWEGKRGHPTFFRWSCAGEVKKIPDDRGLNWLLRRDPDQVELVEASDDSVLWDLDTPDDYARLQAEWKRSRTGGGSPLEAGDC